MWRICEKVFWIKLFEAAEGIKQPDKIVKFEGISGKRYPEVEEDFHITHKNAPQKTKKRKKKEKEEEESASNICCD